MRLFRPIFLTCDWLRQRIRSRRWRPDAALGRRGEDIAHRYLQRQGLRVIERNWIKGGVKGEVDIVAWDGDRLVLIEVKARTTAEFGSPERAIDHVKLRCLRNAAFFFTRRWNVPLDTARLDLVTIVFEPFELNHVPDAWGLHESWNENRHPHHHS